jgi:hypothetical protein
MLETMGYNGVPRCEPAMVKHGALSKSHVYHLLRSNNARVRHAAFTLLERSNPRLRTNSELFVEVTRFIWAANPSYDVYNEFTKPCARGRVFQAIVPASIAGANANALLCCSDFPRPREASQGCSYHSSWIVMT